MVISSLVVETLREYTQNAAEQLAAMSGVEVHEINDFKIVVTIEAPSIESSYERASSFIKIEGVTGVHLVYCNFEEEE